MITATKRTELQQALDLANCNVDLDTALASPTVAKCLVLTVTASRKNKISQDHYASIDLQNTVARLRRQLGKLDYMALQAGQGGKND